MSDIHYDGMYAPKGDSCDDPAPLPKPDPPQRYDKKGRKIPTKLPRGGSYYALPRVVTPGRSFGESRRHGDASHAVQKKAIDAIIDAANKHGLTPRETANILAIAYVESGFNPDAAAGTTTAASLGQFIRETGWAYGLNDSNRFELPPNADALVRHYIENRETAKTRGFIGKELELKIYQYHHDGPGSIAHPAKDRGGLNISKAQVCPYTDKIEKMLNGEKVALTNKKPSKEPVKNSLTVAAKSASAAPRWSNLGALPLMFVRNPTPPSTYHSTRSATATQSQAGKPPASNQPKASLINRLDGWLYDKLCIDDTDEP